MPNSTHGGYIAPDRPIRAEDLPQVPPGPADETRAADDPEED